MAHSQTDRYFVPAQSKAPIFASISLFTLMLGGASWLNGFGPGKWLFFAGVTMMIATLFYWFSEVVRESLAGHYNRQVDVSFRMGMIWFIFSEVMFFAAFFGALFYARLLALPWLGGEGDGVMTNALLWDSYTAAWPTAGPDQVGGQFQTSPAWGLPAFAREQPWLAVGRNYTLLAWLFLTAGIALGGWWSCSSPRYRPTRFRPALRSFRRSVRRSGRAKFSAGSGGSGSVRGESRSALRAVF